MLEDFALWFSSLELLLKVFWSCAIVSSLFFVVQFVLTLIGIGDADMDGMDSVDVMSGDGGMALFTVKNLIHFFLGVGWAGVSLWNLIPSKILLVLVSLLMGVFMVVLFIWLFRKMRSIESHGSYDPREAVGAVCDVYLSIPAARSGKGKVQISLRGAVLEMDALTSGERLATGAKVRVTELLDNHTVLVDAVGN